MPSIETMGRHQKAVLWAYAARDRHGRATVSSPVEIDVRWEEDRREAVGDDGSPIAADVTAWVDRVIVTGSILWKGALADLPTPATNLFRVISREDSPDIKGRVTQRCVTLQRYGDTLPEVV